MIEKNFCKEAEGKDFTKYLRSPEQFIQTMKRQNNYQLVTGGLSNLKFFWLPGAPEQQTFNQLQCKARSCRIMIG